MAPPTETDVRHRAAILDGDVMAARAARNDSAAADAVALTFLRLGPHLSTGLDGQQAHMNGRKA